MIEETQTGDEIVRDMRYERADNERRRLREALERIAELDEEYGEETAAGQIAAAALSEKEPRDAHL